MRWRTLAVLAVSVASLLVAVPAPGGAAPPGFVGTSGGEFTLSGRVWRPMGYNQYRLTSAPGGFVCDNGYGAITEASMIQRLDQMRAAGANVVRTWFFQRYWAQGPAADPWDAFDRIVEYSLTHNFKVIPVLVNHWNDCEWPSIDKNHGFYQSAYLAPGFGNSLSFKDWALMVAERYKDSPAVAFWQLVNEAEASYRDGNGVLQCPADSHLVLRNFADDMTARIKAVDPNHLVSLGTIGSGQCGTSTDEYRHVHAGAVDMCEVHDYNSPAAPMPGDQWNGMAVRLAQCQALGKPIFAGEAGIPADVGPDGSATGTVTAATRARRAQFFDNKIAAQFARGLNGWVIWESLPEPSAGFGVGPGDPVEVVMRAWWGTDGPVPVGFTWSGDGSLSAAGPAGTTVRLYATGLMPNTAYRLVTARSEGGHSPCRFVPSPVNTAVRTSSAGGFIGLTAGIVDRSPGMWEVCFRSVDGLRSSVPVTFTVG